MTRIGLTDTMVDTVVKMSDGNQSAMTVLIGVMKDGAIIDPDCFMGGLGVILGLDTLGIYGPRIWMLYKDVCKENLTHMLGVLRANQLGLLSTTHINAAIDTGGELDIAKTMALVSERLPDFKMEPEPAVAAEHSDD